MMADWELLHRKLAGKRIHTPLPALNGRPREKNVDCWAGLNNCLIQFDSVSSSLNPFVCNVFLLVYDWVPNARPCHVRKLIKSSQKMVKKFLSLVFFASWIEPPLFFMGCRTPVALWHTLTVMVMTTCFRDDYICHIYSSPHLLKYIFSTWSRICFPWLNGAMLGIQWW